MHTCDPSTEGIKRRDYYKFEASLVYLNSRPDRVIQQCRFTINKERPPSHHHNLPLETQNFGSRLFPDFDRAVMSPGKGELLAALLSCVKGDTPQDPRDRKEGAGEQRERPRGTVTTPRSTQRSCRQPWHEATPCVPSHERAATPLPLEAKQWGLHTAGRRPWNPPPPTLRTTPSFPAGVETRPHESHLGIAHIPALFPLFFALSTQLFPTPGRTGKRRRRVARRRRINTMVRSRPFDVTSAPGQDGSARSLPRRLPPGGESGCPWRVVSEVRS